MFLYSTPLSFSAHFLQAILYTSKIFLFSFFQNKNSKKLNETIFFLDIFPLARNSKHWLTPLKQFSWQTLNKSQSFIKEGGKNYFLKEKGSQGSKGISQWCASQGNNMTSNSMSPFLRVNRNQLAMMFRIINSKKKATTAHFRAPPISQKPKHVHHSASTAAEYISIL